MEDLYPIDSVGTDSAPAVYEAIHSRMNALETAIHKAKKKKKKNGKKGGKKYKKRLKTLEAEHQQLKIYLQAFAMQMQHQSMLQYAQPQKTEWWQGDFAKILLPRAADLAFSLLKSKWQPKQDTLTVKGQPVYYLPSGSDKK